MPDRRYLTLDTLIRQANRISDREPDSLQLLAHMLRLALDDGADPYLLVGVLVEGAALAVTEYVPPQLQPEAAVSVVDLLAERLRARGVRW